MRPLFAGILIFLLGAATLPDVAAQNRSPSLIQDILSVVSAEDGRVPTVVMDDHERDRSRDRTERTERAETDGRRGQGGRGTVDGRGNGDMKRGGDGRERTERGRGAGERADGDASDARRSDDGRRDDDRPDETRNDDVYRGEKGEQGKRGKGPAFCRSGEGHPVFGTDWCREKGFGLDRGPKDVRDDDPGELRRGDRRPGGVTNEGGWLEDILGRDDR